MHSASPPANISTTERFLDATLPGSSHVLRVLKPAIEQMKGLSLMKVLHMLRIWGKIQKVTGWPYPLGILEAPGVTFLQEGDQHKKILDQLHRFYLFAVSVYTLSTPRMNKLTLSKVKDVNNKMEAMLLSLFPHLEIIATCPSTMGNIPSHILAADHQESQLILAIRGSAEPADWIINFTCVRSELEGVHCGMQIAAEELRQKLSETVDTFLAVHPTYSLHLCGHSLGGGISTLLALIWDKQYNARNLEVRGWSFGAPCVVPLEVAEATEGIITSVVCGCDLVGRISYSTVEALTKAFKEIDSCLHQENVSVDAVNVMDSWDLLGEVNGPSSRSQSSTTKVLGAVEGLGTPSTLSSNTPLSLTVNTAETLDHRASHSKLERKRSRSMIGHSSLKKLFSRRSSQTVTSCPNTILTSEALTFAVTVAVERLKAKESTPWWQAAWQQWVTKSPSTSFGTPRETDREKREEDAILRQVSEALDQIVGMGHESTIDLAPAGRLILAVSRESLLVPDPSIFNVNPRLYRRHVLARSDDGLNPNSFPSVKTPGPVTPPENVTPDNTISRCTGWMSQRVRNAFTRTPRQEGDYLLMDLTKSRIARTYARMPIFNLDAVSDHLVDSYADALSPEILLE